MVKEGVNIFIKTWGFFGILKNTSVFLNYEKS